MTYSEATEYLFNSAPLFQNIGAGAYKEGLSNTLALDEHFGHPHRSFKTVHVAGTNGKGSVSHTLAAILQSAGYKVGLYTSPHLMDFRERIRVNGEMIPKARVIDFVENERYFFEPLHPSFFELATALAFKYFEEAKVDVAVIEVGLGGRLDCTNIVNPLLSIITNISFDHVQFLGTTLEKIAEEKAGIIKENTPVVIGETSGNQGVKQVFLNKALNCNAPIRFADEECHKPISGAQLTGLCQEKNAQTILTALDVLSTMLHFTHNDIEQGFRHVCDMTGLMGRWQKIQNNPTVICDTGHNTGGWQYLSKQLSKLLKPSETLETLEPLKPSLHIIMGMVGDKDVRSVLAMMPQKAHYYFTQASVKRAMPVSEFASVARANGLHGKEYTSVHEAYKTALANAKPDDTIFIGGSTFIVADFLSTYVK